MNFVIYLLTYLLRSSSDRRLGLYGQLFMMTGSSSTSSNGGFVVVKDRSFHNATMR